MVSIPRWLWIPTAMQTALSAALCTVPLFNLLAYEYCFAVGLLAVPTSLILGAGVAQGGGATVPRFWRAVALGVAHLLPGLGLITLNALRVRNCDYSEGLAFFLLLPVATSMYGASLGYVTGAVLAEARPPLRLMALALVALVPLVAAGWRLYWQPPIFVHDHLWGHFAGSLYDEVVELGPPLFALRAGTALRVLLLAALVALWARRLWGMTLAAAVVVVVTAGLYDAIAGPRFGYRIDRADLERSLPVTVERPGLVVHLPPGLDPARQAAIADDHAFRLHQIEQALDVGPGDVIHSWVYRSADDKARLMGARGTQVAKPWLREIHIHDPVSPHPVMAHELVHVVAAGFGSRLLGVSARGGVAVNLGLVEGLAEAVTVERGDLDLDRWSRALRLLDRAPDVRRILGPSGFWTQAPRRAYTVAGSFVRYLLATYGAEPLRAAYPAGDFRAAYGRSLDDLVRQWEQVIDEIELDEHELRLAEAHFRRPSIFKRTCAHDVAQLRADARRVSAREAVPIHREICEHLGDSPTCQLDVALAHARAGDDDELLALAAPLLAGDSLDSTQRARLLEAHGNVLWRRGDLAGARTEFQEVLELELGSDSQRLQWVRLWALGQAEPLRADLRRFLTGDLQPLAAVVRLQTATLPGDRTVPYLIARQLMRVGDPEGALPFLARSAGHPYPTIESERQRLLADALWQLGRLDEAEAAYRAYAARAPSSGERARALDWVERICWHRARAESSVD